MTTWDPDQYQRFQIQRDRPALDLMLQIPADLDPGEIWDLGCGTGEHAALLARRHPQARVHVLDSSPDMLARAAAREEAVDWVQGDIATWAPTSPPDLIFTNAALHWLDDHAGLFARLAGCLAPGGVLACQMPMTWGAPTHVMLRETAAEGPWAGALSGVQGVRRLLDPERYWEILSPLCPEVNIWSTAYLQVLRAGPDENAVVEWLKGTGLRPYLDALSPDLTQSFLDAYASRLAAAFPRRSDGSTLLPYPRLFLVARRG